MNVQEILSAQRRKTVRHYDLPGDAHFLTFSCFHRLPLLNKDRTRKWFVDSLSKARVACEFDLWAWVIMPEHGYLLIKPRKPEYRIAKILTAIKRPVAEKAVAYLIAKRSTFLEKLTVRSRTRHYRHFWQVGSGQDHNIYEPKTAHRVVEYIHNNPCRRDLARRPEDWYWSSAQDWIGASDVPIRVDRSLPGINEFCSS
jgi:putative transposase